MQDRLAIPDWQNFKKKVIRIFEEIRRDVKGGAPADYIPILAEADPAQFAMSVCTVDGQCVMQARAA